jgi:YD repeat-containing protein
VNIADGTNWVYGYDTAGEQTSATERAADGTLIEAVSYTFDAFGNRISETSTTDY